jgi:transcriptional regulator with AAA-type ATPase domain
MTEKTGPEDLGFIWRHKDRKRMALAALLRNDGNVSKAAFELGISNQTLAAIIKREGLERALQTIRQDARIRKLEEKRFRRYSPAAIRG